MSNQTKTRQSTQKQLDSPPANRAIGSHTPTSPSVYPYKERAKTKAGLLLGVVCLISAAIFLLNINSSAADVIDALANLASSTTNLIIGGLGAFGAFAFFWRRQTVEGILMLLLALATVVVLNTHELQKVMPTAASQAINSLGSFAILGLIVVGVVGVLFIGLIRNLLQGPRSD